MTTTDTDLSVTADRLTRAADRIEELNWDGDGSETVWLLRRQQVINEGGGILAEGSREVAVRIAAFDPYTVAALVPLLRLFADLAADLDQRALHDTESTALRHLDVFARRLLGEEESGD